MDAKFESWAILEIMGHQKYAGRVSEQAIGGASFVRVDVPEIDGRPAFSNLFGGGSIFCITPVSEVVALGTARELKQAPLHVWDLPAAMRDAMRSLPAPVSADSDDYDDFAP